MYADICIRVRVPFDFEAEQVNLNDHVEQVGLDEPTRLRIGDRRSYHDRLLVVEESRINAAKIAETKVVGSVAGVLTNLDCEILSATVEQVGDAL